MERSTYNYENEDDKINDEDAGVLLPRVAIEHENDHTKKKNKKEKTGCKRYRKLIVTIISFSVHFFGVMLLLFGGAMILATIEDPVTPSVGQIAPIANRSELYKNFTRDLELSFNISVNEETLKALMNKIKNFTKETENLKSQEKRKDQKYIFLKWLYFTIITTTTIGYGDVSPKTDKGKILCACFVVIGIILMMTLLARCGAIISSANKKFYGLIRKYLCRTVGKKKDRNRADSKEKPSPLVSNELLSLISIHIIFFCFLFGGIWYGIWRGTNDWSLVDVIYFWFVTFTTCGYGDITYSLDVEVEYIFENTVYRLFGLSILAAIIDSISTYVNYRTELRKKVKEVEQKISTTVSSIASKASEAPGRCIPLKRICRTKQV